MPTGLAPILAVDGSAIGQIVFVLIALLAWILREAAERRAAARPEPREDEEPAAPGALERLLGLFEEGAAPPQEAPRNEEAQKARWARRRQAAAEPVPPELPAADLPPEAPARASEQPFHSAAFRSLEARIGEVALGGATPTGDASVRRSGPAAWRRLGLARRASRHTAARRGLLWSEVLGPPRALAGPHRTPLQRRLDARR